MCLSRCREVEEERLDQGKDFGQDGCHESTRP